MVTIMIVIFLLGVICGTALGGCAIDSLKKERDQWEREAKKWCNQLSELRYKIRQQICDKCQDEDTEKCKECNK